MRWRSVRLGIEHVPKRVVERVARRPAGRRPELGGVPDQMGDVRPSHQLGVDLWNGPHAHEVCELEEHLLDRKSTRLNSSHQIISYAVFCLKKKTSYEKLKGEAV